jgi:transposase-like protein
VLAFELARRHTVAATRFMEKVANAAGSGRFQLSTDGLPAYNFAVGTKLDERCDYGQVIKIYKSPTAEEQRRYSPAKIAECKYVPVYGDPNPARICTSHIERQNGSLRQWCKRLTRLTYAFSKKWENLKAALALHFAYYNFCRIHRTIKKTPAMAAGITNRAWSMADLMAA